MIKKNVIPQFFVTLVSSVDKLQKMSQENMSQYKPKKELRENPLKRALLTYIVPVVSAKYQTIAIRCIWQEVNFLSVYFIFSKIFG